jgi:hypothetical protein
MNWTLAIDLNRTALLRVVAGLFALVGVPAGGAVDGVPRGIRLAVLRVLRGAEAAVRRLIVIAAQDLGALPSRARAAMPSGGISAGDGARVPAFPLFDPRRRITVGAAFGRRGEPRVSFFDGGDPVRVSAPVPIESETVDAARLCQRMQGLLGALDDLPRQARRLARWRGRAAEQAALKGPMRPGRPPGHRERPLHPVDEILRECHTLALRAREAPDTS